MKLPLPLTLAFFLHPLAAVPIPSKYRNILSADCLYHTSAACQSSRPSSSAFAHRAVEQAFNNAPRTPQKHLERSKALSAKVPLESSYLLSPANIATILEQQDHLPKTISATDALAAKPTSALPYLRKEDAKRYWATLRSGSSSSEIEGHDEIVASDKLVVSGSTGICADGFVIKGFYSREPIRGHSDILVVGIIVLFLVAVVAWEAAEIISDIFVAYIRRRLRSKVYSEDNETIASIKKPFFSYRALKPRSKIRANEHGDEGQK